MTSNTSRRGLLALALAGAVVTTVVTMGGTAFAQAAYPSQTIRIVAPFAAGGGADGLARIFAEKLRASTGQQVIVENKPGAGTLIGTDLVAKSAPDGYTILLNVPNVVLTPLMTDKPPYDPHTDLIPVAEVIKSQIWFVVSAAKTEARTLKDFIAEVKAKPDFRFYGSVGPGSIGHLMGYAFNEQVGLDMQHVGYRGGGPASAALAGGELPMGFLEPLSVRPQIDSGKARLLAVSGTQRSKNFPNVPTFGEAGYDGFTGYSWAGLFVPAKTPAPIVQRLTREFRAIQVDPETMARISAIGYDPGDLVGDEFAAMVKGTSDRWGPIIKKIGLKIE